MSVSKSKFLISHCGSTPSPEDNSLMPRSAPCYYRYDARRRRRLHTLDSLAHVPAITQLSRAAPQPPHRASTVAPLSSTAGVLNVLSFRLELSTAAYGADSTRPKCSVRTPATMQPPRAAHTTLA